jgi:hypothetical protein
VGPQANPDNERRMSGFGFALTPTYSPNLNSYGCVISNLSSARS